MKRGGCSYRVRLPGGKFVPLGWNLEDALATYKRLMPADHKDHDALAAELWARSKKGAAARGLEFLLTPEDVSQLVAESGGKCSVSGRKFNSMKEPGTHMRPWAASIDRKDSNKPYTAENCRLVCASVNVAMNSFGDQVFNAMLAGLVRKIVREELRRHFPRKKPSPGAVGNGHSSSENAGSS